MVDHSSDYKNVSCVVKKGLCCGCGTCYALCPNEAIDFKSDSNNGVYQPKIISGKCSSCGICLKICPGLEVDFQLLEKRFFSYNRLNDLIGIYRECYVGYSSAQKLRYNSSSGGVVTELLRVAFKIGLINSAVITKTDIEPHNKIIKINPYLANNADESEKGIGSKYASVPLNVILKKVMKSNGKYGIVGLPCHIHGIRKAQEIFPVLKDRIVFCIGLFCAASFKLSGTYYLMKKMKVDLSKLKSLSYRGNGWPGGMTLEFLDGYSLFIEMDKYYTSDFGAFIMPRCISCCDHSSELADLSCGDAWQKRDEDSSGTSVLVVRSGVGEKLIEHAVLSRQVVLEKANLSDILMSQDMFNNKKRHITATFTLLKILRKPLPKYNGVKLAQPHVESYLIALSVLIKSVLSSREKLWPLLRLFCKATDFINGLVKK